MITKTEVEKVFADKSNWGDIEETMCDCGCNNVHVESVVINQGSDDYYLEGFSIVDHNRIKTVPSSAGTVNRTRGNDVLVVMYCESGCRFAHRYLGHKGCLFVDKIKLTDLDHIKFVNENKEDWPMESSVEG